MRVQLSVSVLVLAVAASAVRAEDAAPPAAADGPWSVRMAEGLVKRYPKGTMFEQRRLTDEPKWSYSTALVVRAIGEVGLQKNKPELVKYARDYADAFVGPDGKIDPKKYEPEGYRLDDIAPGKLLLMLSQNTKDPRYLKASEQLAEQFKKQPRNPDGGFWHKKIYPRQMWADGIYMGCPFLSEYAYQSNRENYYDEAATQILLFANHALDPKTGLVWHGYDDAKEQKWADKKTGLSPNFWGRAVGWYTAGIVETLDYLPAKHPQRGAILKVLGELAAGIETVQDKDTGVWWQVLDKAGEEGNYREASASCMFTYALAKAARLGYIDAHYADVAKRGYAGVLKEFVRNDPQSGGLMLINTCSVAGLGSTSPTANYRDGTYAYYISEPKATNDPKGLGPFLFASLEMERADVKH
jgi:unsaturated rhamnogalacturonyl hydrolase